MSRSLQFEFSSLCGISYDRGDVRFTSDEYILSPIGHRLNRFSLTGSSTETFPFETLSPIHRVSVSKNANHHLLAVVDSNGRGLLCNSDSGAVLHRFHTGTEECNCLEFSQDGLFLAVSNGNKVKVWKCPQTFEKTFSPLVFIKEFTYHSNVITCFNWLHNGNGFITGSMDCTSYLQYFHKSTSEESTVPPKPEEQSVALIGHKSSIIGSFYLNRPLEDPCIFTCSQDGSLLEWRFCTTDTENSTGKHRAKRKNISSNLNLEWRLKNRHFITTNTITSCASNNENIIIFGFSDGVFALHELPSGIKLQSFSASKFAIETCDITMDGKWLALGSPTMGQLLVWEWQSETFVLKQQGHYYNMNCTSYSPDGRVIATGGDDGKVKIWSTSTNTCFVTFTEHEGAITDCIFASNTALLTCSLDGTCRAFDLLRLRNFRTMTPPSPCQLTCIATDGEVVCAGAMEPSHIYMWSLRTGKLLEILTGHTGPVSSLDFCLNKPLLASSSWDGTIRLWEPFSSTTSVESLVDSNQVNQLCVAFRPDGKELCSAGLDGNISFWSVEQRNLRTSMDCRRDLGAKEKVNAYFQSLCYSADGRFILAGGKSTWVFAYDCEKEVLLKKYQLAHRVLKDELEDKIDDEDGDDARKRRWREGKHLPGATRGKDAGKRALMDPVLTVSRIKFSPTGRSWSVSTSQGLITFSLDSNSTFDPVDVDQDCTPQSTRLEISKGEFSKGVIQSLFLGDVNLISECLSAVPIESLSIVAKSIPKIHLPKCLDAIAFRLENTKEIQYNLSWALAIFASLSEQEVERHRAKLLPSLRALQKAVLNQEKLIGKICDENLYDIEFILSRNKTREEE